MNTQQRIDVMLAADAGKPIQRRALPNGAEWIDTDHPGWNFAGCEYRIKPKGNLTYRLTYPDKILITDTLENAFARFRSDQHLNPILEVVHE